MTAPPQWKPTVWRSEKYRRFVASLSCCICAASGCNAHHENLNGGKMGGKESDEFCIPLCTTHHHYRHVQPGGYWQRYGKDPEEVIRRTQEEWEGRGNARGWDSSC